MNAEVKKAFAEINDELIRAQKIHGTEPFKNLHEAYAVFLEEADELWDEIKFGLKRQEGDYLEYRWAVRKEAVQAAAMLTRLIVELT